MVPFFISKNILYTNNDLASKCCYNSVMENTTEKTHFGYQEVDVSQKADKVAEVFHDVAHNYDLMNDLMSGGMHRIWKRQTIALAHLKLGQKVCESNADASNSISPNTPFGSIAIYLSP